MKNTKHKYSRYKFIAKHAGREREGGDREWERVWERGRGARGGSGR